MVFSLTDGLPSGRFEQRGPTEVWIYDELPDDVGKVWADLLGRAPVTGKTGVQVCVYRPATEG